MKLKKRGEKEKMKSLFFDEISKNGKTNQTEREQYKLPMLVLQREISTDPTDIKK